MAGKTYSIEYKIQAMKRVTEDGKSAAQVSRCKSYLTIMHKAVA